MDECGDMGWGGFRFTHLYHLLEDLGCLLLGEIASRYDAIEQLAAGTQFHDEMRRVLVLMCALRSS